jgi:hypothetical protein
VALVRRFNTVSISTTGIDQVTDPSTTLSGRLITSAGNVADVLRVITANVKRIAAEERVDDYGTVTLPSSNTVLEELTTQWLSRGPYTEAPGEALFQQLSAVVRHAVLSLVEKAMEYTKLRRAGEIMKYDYDAIQYAYEPETTRANQQGADCAAFAERWADYERTGDTGRLEETLSTRCKSQCRI